MQQVRKDARGLNQSLKESVKLSFKTGENEFPLDVFRCEKIQRIFSELKKLYYNPDYLAGALIPVAATAIGNGAKIKVKNGWEETVVVYCAIVGNSGTGKTAPLKFAQSPIMKRDIANVKAYNEAIKELDAQTKKPANEQKEIEVPRLVKTIMGDATPEAITLRHSVNHSLLIIVDELPGWKLNLNKYNNGSGVEFYLSNFSNAALNVDRKKDGALIVENPHISIVGGIQPKVLADIFRNETNNGLMARFLMFKPFERPVVKLSDENIDMIVFSDWEIIIENLRQLYYQDFETTIFTYSPEGWETVKNWVNNRPVNDVEAVASLDAKLSTYVHRFALILHLLNNAYAGSFPIEIESITVRNSIKLMEYFRRNAMEILRDMKLDDPLEALDATKLKLYDMLPFQFTTSEGEQISKDNGLLGHTAFSKFIKNKRLFTKITQGIYEKIISDGDND